MPRWLFYIFLVFSSSSLQSQSLVYQLPAEVGGEDVLELPLQIFERAKDRCFEKGIFGPRVHQPFFEISSSVETPTVSGEQGVVHFEACRDDARFLYVSLGGAPVFYSLWSNYLFRIKRKPAQQSDKLFLSALRLSESKGRSSDEIRYDFFMLIDQIPPVTAGDIRVDLELSDLEKYIQSLGRFESKSSAGPLKGLQKIFTSGGVNTGKRVGYVFSNCLIFRDSPLQRQNGEQLCHIFPMDDHDSVVPVLPAQPGSSSKSVYLIERQASRVESGPAQATWQKVEVLPQKVNILRDNQWKPSAH